MTKVCVMKTTDDERFFKRSRNQKTHAIGLFFAWKKTKILTNSRQSERREFWFNSRNSFTHVFSRKERGGARRNTDSIASLSFVVIVWDRVREEEYFWEWARERKREEKKERRKWLRVVKNKSRISRAKWRRKRWRRFSLYPAGTLMMRTTMRRRIVLVAWMALFFVRV